MAFIATLSEEHKKGSTWATGALLLFDWLAIANEEQFPDLSVDELLLINMVGALGIKAATLIKQRYKVSQETKAKMISQAQAQPVKDIL